MLVSGAAMTANQAIGTGRLIGRSGWWLVFGPAVIDWEFPWCGNRVSLYRALQSARIGFGADATPHHYYIERDTDRLYAISLGGTLVRGHPCPCRRCFSPWSPPAPAPKALSPWMDHDTDSGPCACGAWH